VTTNPLFEVTAAVPPPTITGEQVGFNQKRNKGKPIGKSTLSGYMIDFSTAMNQASIGTPANYAVDIFVLKKQGKKKKVLVPHQSDSR